MSDDVAGAVAPGEGYDLEEEAANQVERVGEEDGRVEEEARPTEFLGSHAATAMVMVMLAEYAPEHGVVEDARVQDARDQGQQDRLPLVGRGRGRTRGGGDAHHYSRRAFGFELHHLRYLVLKVWLEFARGRRARDDDIIMMVRNR